MGNALLGIFEHLPQSFAIGAVLLGFWIPFDLLRRETAHLNRERGFHNKWLPQQVQREREDGKLVAFERLPHSVHNFLVCFTFNLAR